jgi:hypothetical protein
LFILVLDEVNLFIMTYNKVLVSLLT